MENFKPNARLFVLAFMSFCLPLLAFSAQSDDEAYKYEWLARVGSLGDIQDAYENNKKAFTAYIYGEQNETFLMLVLKNNRDYDIIRFCVDVDVKVKNRVTTFGRTPLMYAARYCTDERVISLILKNSFLLAQNRRAYVLQRDKNGYDAFAYSRNNTNFKVYMELYKYAPDSGITMNPEDDLLHPNTADDSENSHTRSTTPPPASPTESAAPPPPSVTSEVSTPPPAQIDNKTDNTTEDIPSSQFYLH